MRGKLRRGDLPAENVAPCAFVFGLAGLLDRIIVELRVIHANGMIILRCGNGIGGHNRLVMVKIQKPDEPRDQQEDDEHGELFRWLHAPVLK